MHKWLLVILVISSAMVLSCGGKKLKNAGGGSADEIFFINDTPANTYRITVVGTELDFTLRSSTQKGVRVPIREEAPAFNINIERTEGTSGQVRISVTASAGETVRIFSQDLSFGSGEEVVVEIGA
jgi:hypothetical protein